MCTVNFTWRPHGFNWRVCSLEGWVLSSDWRGSKGYIAVHDGSEVQIDGPDGLNDGSEVWTDGSEVWGDGSESLIDREGRKGLKFVFLMQFVSLRIKSEEGPAPGST